MTIETEPPLRQSSADVIAVVQSAPYLVEPDDYPWINHEAEVSTVVIETVGGALFRYGSVIGLNHTVASIADSVSRRNSELVQQKLFSAMPSLLSHQPSSVVRRVDSQYDSTNLLKVGSCGNGSARLIFDMQAIPGGLPVVMRVGICSHDKQARLMSLITTNSPKRLRKHDGLRHVG